MGKSYAWILNSLLNIATATQECGCAVCPGSKLILIGDPAMLRGALPYMKRLASGSKISVALYQEPKDLTTAGVVLWFTTEEELLELLQNRLRVPQVPNTLCILPPVLRLNGNECSLRLRELGISVARADKMPLQIGPDEKTPTSFGFACLMGKLWNALTCQRAQKVVAQLPLPSTANKS